MDASEVFARGDEALMSVLRIASAEEVHGLVQILRKESPSLKEDTTWIVDVACAFERAGGNGIANSFRGHGVAYEEIVGDVANAAGADMVGATSLIEKEWRILVCLIDKLVKGLDEKAFATFKDRIRQVTNQDWRGTGTEALAELNPAGVRAAVETALTVAAKGETWDRWAGVGALSVVLLLTGLIGGGLLVTCGLVAVNTQVYTAGVMWVGLLRLQAQTENFRCYIGGQP